LEFLVQAKYSGRIGRTAAAVLQSHYMSGRNEIMEPANRESDIGPVVGNPEWIARQGELEDAARVVRWLTHDFGNILTGIFGFSELSLSLLSPNSPAYEYTKEIQRSAQRAAEF